MRAESPIPTRRLFRELAATPSAQGFVPERGTRPPPGAGGLKPKAVQPRGSREPSSWSPVPSPVSQQEVALG